MSIEEQTERFPALKSIGGRIRMIRRQRGMTQSELVGDDLTRNMLSRIENGAALPSLQTLCHIAARLEVPAGALLGDLGDYTDWQRIKELRRLLSQKKYERVIERCKADESIDSEGDMSMILCEAYAGRAYELYDEGHLSSALQYLEAAERIHERVSSRPEYHGVTALYSEADTLSERIFLLRTLISACPALYPGDAPVSIDEHTERLRTVIFEHNDTAIYLYCIAKLSSISRIAYSQPHELSKELRAELDAMTRGLEGTLFRIHIDAKLHMINADYLDAKAKLLKLLNNETPPALLYDILADLEFCCKCCGDFENAYRYSGQRLELAKRIN